MGNLSCLPSRLLFPGCRNHLSCRAKVQKKEKNRGIYFFWYTCLDTSLLHGADAPFARPGHPARCEEQGAGKRVL